MPRRKLKKLEGDRLRFTARVERYGFKPKGLGLAVQTILLSDVRLENSGDMVADHLWFQGGKWCDGVLPGSRIAFDAKVRAYTKGYKGQRDDVDGKPVTKDWQLSWPSKVKVLVKPAYLR